MSWPLKAERVSERDRVGIGNAPQSKWNDVNHVFFFSLVSSSGEWGDSHIILQ